MAINWVPTPEWTEAEFDAYYRPEKRLKDLQKFFKDGGQDRAKLIELLRLRNGFNDKVMADAIEKGLGNFARGR